MTIKIEWSYLNNLKHLNFLQVLELKFYHVKSLRNEKEIHAMKTKNVDFSQINVMHATE